MRERNILNTPIYSIREIEASMGWKRWSNGCCKKHAESSEEQSSPKKTFNKRYPKRKGKKTLWLETESLMTH